MALIPEDDELYLKQKAFNYELRPEGAETHLILKGWTFPEVYLPRFGDILIRIPAGYPLTQLDMFWTRPDIKVANTGQWPDKADVHEVYAGLKWQRWSRHGEWRAGVDNLRTFITSIAREIGLEK